MVSSPHQTHLRGPCVLSGPVQPLSPSWMLAEDAQPATLREGSRLSPAELLARVLCLKKLAWEQLYRCRGLEAGGTACCDPSRALGGGSRENIAFWGPVISLGGGMRRVVGAHGAISSQRNTAEPLCQPQKGAGFALREGSATAWQKE